ncbi:MAG: HlyD family efflux transporter periplasmic adaptor subunit [Flavobacterium sp.]
MNKNIKHSEEFTDSVNQFPEFNTILFYSLLGIIGITFFMLSIIKSPEIIIGEAKVTAEKPAIEIMAHNSGRIIIKDFVSQKKLKKDTFLAVIENSADDGEVLELKKALKSFKNKVFDLKQEDINFAIDYKLGEIEEYYLNLMNVLYSLEKAEIPNEFDKKKSVLNQQSRKYFEMLNQRKGIKKIKETDILLLKNKTEEDSILFAKGLIIKSEYEQDQRNYLHEKENLKNYEARDIENKLSINDNIQNVDLLNFQKKLNISDLEIKLLTAYQELIQSINFWEAKYVLKVPIDGKVDMMQFITSYQTIKQGEPVFSILPDDNKVLAQLIVPPNGAGKIKIGQDVIIKLVSYPYQEFGKLIGKVKSISLIPTQNYYLITADLPKGLKSDTGQLLSFSKNMIGTAEIVTAKRSLLLNLFDKIVTAFDKTSTEKKEKDNL